MIIPIRKSKCGWCYDQPHELMDRFWNSFLGDLVMKGPLIYLLSWWWSHHPGRAWHNRFHRPYLERLDEKIRNNWEKNLSVGDRVCDCRLKHSRIKEINHKEDEAIMEDGFGCSISHCLDPIDHTEESHIEALEAWKKTRQSESEK